jgi:predicted AlkP superfamily phosphohydrolase/phosphomutase
VITVSQLKSETRFIVMGLDGACPGIIEAAVSEGLLPNFQRLRERGCWADNVPFPAAVTPGNWASIATGAKPATHGISDFYMHTPGAPLDEAHGVFQKGYCRAEFLWDAYSDRGLKAATIAFPGALPQTKPGHLAIGNDGQPAENGKPYTVAPSRALVAGALDPVGPYDWHEHERVALAPPGEGPGVAGFEPKYALQFAVEGVNPGYAGRHDFTLYLGHLHGREGGVLVEGDRSLPLGKREWTPFLEKTFAREVGGEVVGEFRLRIVELDLEAGDLLLYVSTVYPKYDFSSDPEVTRALRDRFGPYNDNLVISRLLMGWLDAEGFRDEFRLQGLWEARAAVALVNELGYRAVFAKWHAFDKFYHFFMHKIDPEATGYVPQEAERYESLHRIVLEIADEMIGVLLDGLGEGTSLVVISDHGLMASRRALWVNRLLAQRGYLHFGRDESGKVRVDWSRTRAYVSAFQLLNVNLVGRDPEGIVQPGEEYESLKRELTELLRGWTDPETGAHVMTDVFDPRTDGAFYGLGSELDGDVRYFAAPGYSLYRSTDVDGEGLVTDITGPFLGDHGSGRPTTRFGRGSEVGIFYAAGRGFAHRPKRPTPIFPCDVTPTLLQITGEAPLAQQEGAVLHDLLTEAARGTPGGSA